MEKTDNESEIKTEKPTISDISENELTKTESKEESTINEPKESNQVKNPDLTETQNIFDSLTLDSDRELGKDEVPRYFKEVRLAVIGNVDSGKSTLVGCLTRGVKDDGRGYARKFVFNYQHENESGRTSSIAEEIMGFKNGKLVSCGRANEKKNVSWKEITSKSDHVITLLDLCGHEKYLKTTMYGISALVPHYAVILIGSNMGVQRMTKEHLGIVVSLGVPFFVIFTKIDIAPKEVKEKTINGFVKLLKSGLQKTVFTVKSNEDALFAANSITGGNFVPVFSVSTVTGETLEELKTFLGHLVPKPDMNLEASIIKTAKDKTEMLLDHAFNTKVGCIHAGLVTSGKISVGQKLLMGPTHEGQFKPVQIREIQFLRVSTNELCCGNSCSVKLKSLDKMFELSTNNFKKGMVLLDQEEVPKPTLEFEVEAIIVHHSSTIKVGYQSVVHCRVVRQTCTIVAMDKEFLRAGDKGIIKFKFLKKPEFIHLGDVILFREGRTRGKGKIIKLYPFDLDVFNNEKKTKQKQTKFNQPRNKTGNVYNSNNAKKAPNTNVGKKKDV